MTPNSAVTASNMATIPWPSTDDLTAEVATQSKEFREELKFESLMMILCNRHASWWDNGPRLALKAGCCGVFCWTPPRIPCCLRDVCCCRSPNRELLVPFAEVD